MKKLLPAIFTGFAFLFLGFSITKIVLEDPDDQGGDMVNTRIMSEAFQRKWIFVSETSAIIYWQLEEIGLSANSYVEYGKTEKLGFKTLMTKKPRWAHWHRLKGLESGEIYYYRMVFVDPAGEYKTESEILKIEPEIKENAIRIPGDMSGSTPYILDQTDRLLLQGLPWTWTGIPSFLEITARNRCMVSGLRIRGIPGYATGTLHRGIDPVITVLQYPASTGLSQQKYPVSVPRSIYRMLFPC
jgi:hypothetical protein